MAGRNKSNQELLLVHSSYHAMLAGKEAQKKLGFALIALTKEAHMSLSRISKLAIRGRHKDLERSCTSRKSVAPTRNKILVYPDSDKEDEDYYSMPLLLPSFQTPQPCAILKPVHHNNHSEVDIERAENIRKMEHEVPNRCDNITDYEDNDQEYGRPPDLPNFSATNEFASVCEQGKGTIDVNTAQELEEVQVEDVEIDEDYNIDHSNTKEAIQWSHTHDPFLVVLEPDVQSSFLLRTIPSSISNEVKREFKIPHRFMLLVLVFLVATQGDWMLLMEELDVGDSEHGLEHVVSLLYRANPGEFFILILLSFLFHFLNCTIGTLYKPSGGWE
ncbi:hypothetical protein Tco_0428846 [Tanacetum coccineum]